MTEVISRNSSSIIMENSNDHNDDHDGSIDEIQLAEYQEMVEELGSFPDKVKINTLTMIAEDYVDSIISAEKIYHIIHHRLISTTNRDNLLPIVYVIDSILKNVKGCYIRILEKDAIHWIPIIYSKLHYETQRMKLEKVWKTWNEFKLFSVDSWKIMGQCFSNSGEDNQRLNNNNKTIDLTSSSAINNTILDTAGIMRTKDGNLLFPINLRKKMQSVLDEIQSEVKDELEKVSLERLADINPKLLIEIKVTAESIDDEQLDSRGPGSSSKNHHTTSTTNHNKNNESQQLPSFFTETRLPQTIHIAKEWTSLKSWKPIEQSQEVIRILDNAVIHGGSLDTSERYTKDEAIKMTQYYATVSATVNIIKSSLDRIVQLEQQQQQRTNTSNNAIGNNNHNKYFSAGGNSSSSSSFAVDKKEFTNEGIKKKNLAVIGLLYEVGLPFVSSLDGRRFRTQIELSKHLDALFRRSQWEKSSSSSTRTEERGWYVSDTSWISGNQKDKNKDEIDTSIDNIDSNDVDDDIDNMNEMYTVPADESRDRCVICGIKFKMYFDSDDGIYKYNNCKEIEVLNDDAAENESELKLVHGSCWKGLGSPEVLTLDQALQ